MDKDLVDTAQNIDRCPHDSTSAKQKRCKSTVIDSVGNDALMFS